MDDSDNFIFNNGFGEPYGTEGGGGMLNTTVREVGDLSSLATDDGDNDEKR